MEDVPKPDKLTALITYFSLFTTLSTGAIVFVISFLDKLDRVNLKKLGKVKWSLFGFVITIVASMVAIGFELAEISDSFGALFDWGVLEAVCGLIAGISFITSMGLLVLFCWDNIELLRLRGERGGLKK